MTRMHLAGFCLSAAAALTWLVLAFTGLAADVRENRDSAFAASRAAAETASELERSREVIDGLLGQVETLDGQVESLGGKPVRLTGVARTYVCEPQ